MSETVVLLHGFAASPRHWDRVLARLDRERYSALALALSDVEPRSPAGVVEHIAARTPARFTLCGYSMGGRLALATALAYPDRVGRLVLVSASAGISDAAERERRRVADRELAERIEAQPIDAFVGEWRGVALFESDPEWVADEVASEQRTCQPAELAAMLRAFGPGEVDAVWDRLGELTMPVVVLAGERDPRYCELGRRLADSIPQASLEIVAGAGHRIALEAPAAVAAAIMGVRSP